MSTRTTIAVIGGGIVGMATAVALTEQVAGAHVIVLDKEQVLGAHQTGRNSGVIHSGVYYTPGSAKATTCRRGRALLLDLCRTHDIPHEVCGKVIVAVEEDERAALATIAARGAANGVSQTMLDAAGLSRVEPHVRGVQALHVHDAGIVDYVAVTRTLAGILATRGGVVHRGHEVTDIDERDTGVRLTVRGPEVAEIEADLLVSCTGLQSDRVTAMGTGRAAPMRIVPFRGEYHALTDEAARLCRTLIYPVPDPRFPFLGVHLTRHISGRVLAGPNAVLALAREGYRWRDLSPRDLGEVLTNPGMRRLARANWRTGLGEVQRSLSRRAFTRALQRMTPDIRARDLRPVRAGVRAQALAEDGSLADDFVITRRGRGLYVLNAPSPAATASLAIAEQLATDAAAMLAVAPQ